MMQPEQDQNPKQQQDPIQVENVRKAFGSQTVLNGISLRVRGGETLALLGRSGTGKSVLLKLLIGLQQADSGSVQVLGEEITKLESEQLNGVRKKVGFLFQQAALYDSLTVEQNVEFPIARHTKLSPQDRQKKVRDLLASVGMDRDTGKMPSDISGGMRKRVGLARALALDPEVILFDEPTAGLDPITATEIGELILDLKKKRKITSIVVTHDLRTTRIFADRLLLIHEGKIRAEGTFEELQANHDEFVARFFKDAQ